MCCLHSRGDCFLSVFDRKLAGSLAVIYCNRDCWTESSESLIMLWSTYQFPVVTIKALNRDLQASKQWSSSSCQFAKHCSYSVMHSAQDSPAVCHYHHKTTKQFAICRAMQTTNKFYWSITNINNIKIWLLTLRKESRDPFSMNSVMIMTGLLLVTTPSRWMTFGWSNWPMMLASLRKSRLCFSV